MEARPRPSLSRVLPLIVAVAAAASSCTAARPGGQSHTRSAEPGAAHPLTGRIYDVAERRFVSEESLASSLSSAGVVVLGEQHDHAGHHLFQARMLSALVHGGRRPLVAFEQLDLEDQPAVDASLERSRGLAPSRRADELAEAVAWEKSGWPAFAIYRPVVEAALGAELPIRGANLSREALRAKPPAAAAPVRPLAPAARRALEKDIVAAHCGHANERMVTAMVEAQRRRDTAMATAVVDAPDDGAVLICGFGHARADYGVPSVLASLRPGLRVVSVGQVAVQDEVTDPEAYATLLHAASLPFDFVRFTTRVDDEDPCEKFRRSLEAMRNAGPASGAAAVPR